MTNTEVFRQALSGCQKLGQQFPGNPLLAAAQAQLQYLVELEQGKRLDWERLTDLSLGLITVREVEGVDDALANWIYDWVLPAVKELQQRFGHASGRLALARQTVILDDYIETLHFTPDGTTLVSALMHNEVRLWYVSGQQLVPQRSFPSGLKRLYNIALSPDGTQLAAVGEAQAGQKPLTVWKLPSGKKEAEFSFPDSYLLSAAFSSDGTRLLAAGSREMLYVVHLPTGKIEFAAGEEPLDEEEAFWGLGERNTSIVYHPDGITILVTACGQGGSGVVFCELDTRRGTLTPRKDLTMPLVYDVLMPAAFSPNGRFFAFADWNVKVYSFPEQALIAVFGPAGQRLPEPTGDPVVRRVWSNTLFTPDGQTLLCGSPTGAIFLWDVPSGNLRQTLTGHEGSVLWLALDPTGTGLASSGHDKTLRLWQIMV